MEYCLGAGFLFAFAGSVSANLYLAYLSMILLDSAQHLACSSIIRDQDCLRSNSGLVIRMVSFGRMVLRNSKCVAEA